MERESSKGERHSSTGVICVVTSGPLCVMVSGQGTTHWWEWEKEREAANRCTRTTRATIKKAENHSVTRSLSCWLSSLARTQTENWVFFVLDSTSWQCHHHRHSIGNRSQTDSKWATVIIKTKKRRGDKQFGPAAAVMRQVASLSLG